MAVNLGTTSISGYISRSAQQTIVETSGGTLVLFTSIDHDLVYKTSSDGGATWSASWENIFTLATTLYSFDVLIDASDNIHVVYYVFYGNQRAYYQKLTNDGDDTFTLGTQYSIASGTANDGVKFAVRANGDFWVVSRTRTYYSTNSGANWSAVTSPVSSSYAVSVIPVGDDIWLFSQQGATLYYFIYTSSWGSGISISGSISNSSTRLGVLKISNTDIWAVVGTSTGLKAFHYTGSWDAGELITNHANDGSPFVALVGTTPIVIWSDYDGTYYDVMYRIFDVSWGDPVSITDDNDQELWLSGCFKNDTRICCQYLVGASSPYTLYYDTVPIAGAEVASFSETITLSDSIEALSNPRIQIINESIILSDDTVSLTNPAIQSINDTIYISDSILSLTNPAIAALNESITLSDLIDGIPNPATANISESITITDIVTGSLFEEVNNAVRILSYNPLIIVTQENPVKLVIVNTTNPAVPTFTSYTLSNVINANDLQYNSAEEVIYVFGESGIISKIDINTFIETEVDLSDANDIDNGVLNNDFSLAYASTDDASGELYLLDFRETELIANDFQYLSETDTLIPCDFNYVEGFLIANDFQYLSEVDTLIATDFKYVTSTVISNISPISPLDFKVYIDNVQTGTTDLVQDSITIQHNESERSNASFKLTRRHDALDITLAGVTSQITNQNAIRIEINGNVEFNGFISELLPTLSDTEEYITVNALAEQPTEKYNNVTLSYASNTEALSIYNCLMSNMQIYNPKVNANDEDPVIYKGVTCALGQKIQQNLSKYIDMSIDPDDVISGKYQPKDNWNYFWFAAAQNLKTGNEWATLRYIGTSLSSMGAELWKILSVSPYRQRVYEDIVTELDPFTLSDYEDLYDNAADAQDAYDAAVQATGLGYTVGIAPFKLISARNGIKFTSDKWENKEDGLYKTRDEAYNFQEYIKTITDLEYSKMTDLSGNILPQTSATLTITPDAYYFNNIKLLTRINIDNTTVANTFKNSNGFPVSVKSISISSADLKVVLSCTNMKSNIELEDIDGTFPDENDYIDDAISILNFRKYNPITNNWVS
jgi:hypothetical protein